MSIVRWRSRGSEGDVLRQAWRQRVGLQERVKLPALLFGVAERIVVRFRLQEEVEGVVDRRFGHQVDLDAKLANLFREHEPRHVVALWVLLPVDEVRGGRHALRVREDPCATVRGGTQPHELGDSSTARSYR